jgi:hypothetical protein
VGAQDAVEDTYLKLLAENIDLVRAEQAKAIRTEQFVPQFLQAHGRRRVTGVPKQIYHLTVSPQACIPRLGAELPDRISHGILKSLRVRLAVYHESGERISGIQKYKAAFQYGFSRLQNLLLEFPRTSFPVPRHGNGD